MDLHNTLTRTSTVDRVHVHAKTYIILACINFAYFAQLVALVGSGLLAQSIQKLLGGQANESTWFSQSLTILTVTLTPCISQIANLWGRKWPLVISMVCGGVGSIVVSRAQTMGSAIAGFCVIGIALAGQPLLHAIVSEILPRKHRPLAQASLNAAAGIGAFIGLCMGGALLRGGDLQQYRLYFYVTSGIFFLSAAGLLFSYSTPPREEQTVLTTWQKLGSIDWVGYALLTPGLVLFCVALSWSRNPYPWSSPRIIATFVVGVVLIIAFCLYEWRLTSHGILDHGLFKDRNFALSLVLIFVEGLAFFAANNYFAFEVGTFTGADLLVSGLHFGVAFLVSAVFAFVAGWYSTNRRALRSPAFSGFLLILVFFISLAATTTLTPGNGFWGISVALGMGVGLLLPTVMVLAQLVTPPELIATASALIIATRSLGGTVGLAINNALFNSALSTEIPKRIAAATLPLGLPPTSISQLIGALTTSNQAALTHVPGATPEIIGAAGRALISAYGVGFRNAWIASACFIIPALVVSVFIRDPVDEFTAHIDAPAEEAILEKQARLEGLQAPKILAEDTVTHSEKSV